jgi:biofilm PGA synthesis N-glycosyltransferase PgaC
MFDFFLIIYLTTAFLCAASFFIYPFVIWIIGIICPFKVRTAEIRPFVSILISAYNESKHIEKKIENTLALDYPPDKMEILIGSDGSQDETAALVKKYEKHGLQLFDFQANRGKTAVQNDLVTRSRGEILIFTDAASFLTADTIQKIVANFNDERVGCVAGRMRFINTDQNLTTKSQGLYWQYESKLRNLESRVGSLIGVDGPLYAIRRRCYVPLAHNVISDLLTPLLILENGSKVVLETEARVDEAPTVNAGQEFATRRRITLRGLVGIRSCARLLNPIKHPFLAFQIIFHKIVRWFTGLLLMLNLLACAAISDFWLFKIILIVYLLFMAAAVFGWFGARNGIKMRLFSVPYYFSLVNLAATIGVIDFLMNKQAATWQTVRS